jgi:hypothetical protein
MITTGVSIDVEVVNVNLLKDPTWLHFNIVGCVQTEDFTPFCIELIYFRIGPLLITHALIVRVVSDIVIDNRC